MTETQIKEKKDTKSKKQKKINPFLLFVSSMLVFTLLGFSLLFHFSISITPKWIVKNTQDGIEILVNPEILEMRTAEIEEELEYKVTPEGGIAIPVKWNALGAQMIDAGVIDKEKFYSLYERRGGLGDYEKELLEGEYNDQIFIDADNANVILNLLWALGLANKNVILEEGPITDERYGGDASKFAATGGWTLAEGNPMNHYSAHQMIKLSDEQQKLVEEVTKNIYRPCCGNSTYFPDCNHGMAMLGLMQLMASQGATGDEMYDAALSVNSFWFPSTYMTIGKYFAKRGVSWDEINAKEVLGSSYSSAQGYRQIAQEVEPVNSGGGGSCGV